MRMKPWTDQIDELVAARSYTDAQALLDVIDQALLPDKVANMLLSVRSRLIDYLFPGETSSADSFVARRFPFPFGEVR